MPEPMDTIRRVNSGEPMTVEELRQARAVLDAHSRGRKTDVIEARRRVGAMLAELERPEPAGQQLPVANPLTGDGRAASTTSGGVAVAAVLVGALALLGGCVAWVVNRDDPDGDRQGAIAYCHQFVEQQLKSPSSADFPSNGEHQVTELGAQRWEVSSYVDADNSFGASMRTDWTCEISYDEAAGEWTLEQLSGL